MEVDRAARLANLARVRRLSLEHGQAVRIFCAHDATECELLRAPVPLATPSASA